MPDVIMPRLSDSMTEGTIVRWLRADGDEVKRGEEIVEIETDKATMAYESDHAGTLAIREPEGAVVAVGAVIATVGEAVAAPAEQAEPVAVGVAAAAEGARPAAVPPSELPANGASGNGRAAERRVKASPLARRIARELDVELASVTGSGPHGRIIKRDVVAAADAGVRRAGEAAMLAPAAVATPEGARRQELTRTQSLIARRMTQSRSTVPEFALEVDVDMSGVLRMRSDLKALADPAPSLNDLIVKASALALRRHPRANGSFAEDGFTLHPRVNVAVAVAVEGSLLTPVVRDADTKSLGAIAQETRELVERARAGRISPAELDGATFTVSNLGMFGIDRFEGIINAPQSAILCVGAVRDRPVAVDGEVAIRPIATLTLACDHRILYGADAAAFLVDIRRFLEQPMAMVL
ncbi:MAG TPA: dihydrolipoamide acetyltransferase family protein [Solirubrobacteraceae bacterium]|jgi:pyruvate dehydrogenase E2 component (dihydrolipoamide acetyltransferase)